MLHECMHLYTMHIIILYLIIYLYHEAMCDYADQYAHLRHSIANKQ